MAILKHIASKNADYSKALEYLMFEHDERTGKTIRDENGKLIMRNRFIIDGINCDAYSFDKACERVNAAYHKNQTKNEMRTDRGTGTGTRYGIFRQKFSRASGPRLYT